MTQEEGDSSLRFDEEMGVHHGGNGMETSEVERRYDFEVETEPVFKRLAEDIYQGQEAGIREPLTNSVTSVIRATEEGYLDNPDEGIIVIQLFEEGNALRLTLRDNGVGITRDELDKVVTQIGKSTSRSAEKLTGKFGMGFLATWMLAGGTDGGFGMYSNPRGVDEGPFFGFWDNSGFSEMEPPTSSVAGLSENEYGVEFEIFVDQTIGASELINWIDKYSEWTRVPVLFRHHTEEGVVDEEYPPKELDDKYDTAREADDLSEQGFRVRGDKLNLYEVEHDAFHAINSNLEEITNGNNRSSVFTRSSNFNNCILMDVPIKPNWKSRNNFPLESLEIRFHYETPYVVDGPHEGYFVVTGDEDPENLGDDYIKYESLTTEDVVTPFPTGTRDYLQDEMGFTEWLSEKFFDMYYEDIAENVRAVNDLDDYCSLSDEEVEEFHEVAQEICSSYQVNTVKDISEIESKARTTFDSEFKKALPLLSSRSISLAPRGENGVSRQQNRTNTRTREIVRRTHENDERRVFMAHRVTQERADFAWASDNKHYVVRIASSEQQDFKDCFGWEELGDLDFEEDLDIPEGTRKKFTESSQSVEDEQVTLHIGNYSTTKKMTAEELKENIRGQETIVDNNDKEHEMRRLILFDRTDDNISHNKDIVGSSIGTVSVSSEVYDYLTDEDNVWTADIIEDGVDVPISNGEVVEIPEGSFPENAVYHVVDEETASYFRNETVMQSVEEWIRGTDAPDDAVYIPITPVEKDFAGVNIGYQVWSIDTQYQNGSGYRTAPSDSDVELYVKAVLDDEGQEYEALKTVKANWSDGGRELVEAVVDDML